MAGLQSALAQVTGFCFGKAQTLPVEWNLGTGERYRTSYITLT